MTVYFKCKSDILDLQSANFFFKIPDSKYLQHVDHMVSVTIIGPCHCSLEAAIENTKTNGCVHVPVRLYLQKQKQALGQIGPSGYSLVTSVLDNSHEQKGKK